jgi:hypothetical protein
MWRGLETGERQAFSEFEPASDAFTVNRMIKHQMID